MMPENQRFRRKPIRSLVLLACSLPASLLANPTDGVVVSGQAVIESQSNVLTVTTATSKSIINWQTFNIAPNEVTRFVQPSSTSSVLNRVLANEPSSLLGSLQSNGRVYLVNPYGILVGPNAHIDVAGFVASTLNIGNQDFLDGNLNFQADMAAGKVDNQGGIRTPDGGFVYLIAPQVENSGVIETPGGTTILAAGQTVKLVDTATPGVSVEITGTDTQATNLGRIMADAGTIGMAGALVRNSGALDANSVVSEGGRVFLKATQSVSNENAGTVSANGATGGRVDIDADWVALGGHVVADGQDRGGLISIRAGGLSLAGSLQARAVNGMGGSIVLTTATRTYETADSLLDVSGAMGGSITHLAGQQITSSGKFLAIGNNGAGGHIDVTAPAIKLLSSAFDASGTAGGGRIRIGGEFQGGKNLAVDELLNAQLLAVNNGVSIKADGTAANAPGGNIVLWADQEAAVYGDISAIPGLSGSGGSIEVSSAGLLTFGGMATAGVGGSVLFDPKDIVIDSSGSASQYALILGYNYAPLNVGGLNSNDRLGSSVSLNANGDRMAVGAEGQVGVNNCCGEVFLFSFTDGDFNGGVLEGIVGKGFVGGKNVDMASLVGGYYFGTSVSLNAAGNRLAVGAPGGYNAAGNIFSSGTVSLLSFTDGNFSGGSLQGTIGLGYAGAKDIDLSVLQAGDNLGTSVSFNSAGDRLAVGARDDGFSEGVVQSGAVYLFSFTDTNFSRGTLEGIVGNGYLGAKDIDVSVLQAGDLFGDAVSLNALGDRMIVGAPRDDGNGEASGDSGAVYLFSFTDTTFSGGALQGRVGYGYSGAKDVDIATLDSGDRFGVSAALDAAGDKLAAGAQMDAGALNNRAQAGAVYVVGFTDTSFSGGSKLSTIGYGYSGANDVDVATLESSDQFGYSVALNGAGDRLAAGAWMDSGASNAKFASGAVYFFSLGAGSGSLGGSTFGNDSLVNYTLSPSTITAILNTGSNVTLQAENDITLTQAITANNTTGDGGNLTLQAGRSIFMNANVTTDNGDLTLIANDSGADVGRDAGLPVITIASGIAIDTGTGALAMDLRSGFDAVVGNITNLGTLSIGAGSSIHGSFINSGTFTINAGTLGFTSGDSFSNQGIFNLSGSSNIRLQDAGNGYPSFSNALGGVLNINSTAGWSFISDAAAQGGIFNNAGTINANNSTSWEAAFTNAVTGSLNIAAGQYVSMQNGQSIAGSVTLGAGSTLWVSERHGTNAAFNGTTINGSGTVQLAAGVGPVADFTNVTAASATLLVAGGGTANILSGTTTFSNLNMTGGTLGGAGTLNVTNSMLQSGGTQSGSGTTVLASAASGTLGGVNVSRALTSQGNLTLNSTSLSALLTNTGTVTANGTVGASGGILLNTGGTLMGSGTINGNVNNASGTVAPGNSPGILTITGNYTQGAGGTLLMQLAGDTTGSYDQLVVNGVANLGGTLTVQLLAGFTPVAGQSFDELIFATGGINNDFQTLNLPAGYNFSRLQTVTAMDLIVDSVLSSAQTTIPGTTLGQIDSSIENSGGLFPGVTFDTTPSIAYTTNDPTVLDSIGDLFIPVDSPFAAGLFGSAGNEAGNGFSGEPDNFWTDEYASASVNNLALVSNVPFPLFYIRGDREDTGTGTSRMLKPFGICSSGGL